MSAHLYVPSFPPDVLESLWDPSADTKWYKILAGADTSQSLLAKARSVVLVFIKASIRFALAALVSYLVADLIVIDAFKPTVDARATQILEQQQKEAKDNATAAYKKTVNTAQHAIGAATALVGRSDNVKTAKQQQAMLQKKFDDASNDVDKLTKYDDAELQGVKGLRVTLSDGVTYPASRKGTTGVPGCALECHEAESRLNQERQEKLNLQGQLATATRVTRQALGKAGNSASISIRQAQQQIRTAHSVESQSLDQAATMSVKPRGLLIRREALHQLEQNETPWALKVTAPRPCAGSFAWVCRIKTAVFPSTPLGVYVGVFRGILFLIDILPVLLKIFYSLRGRRPFDVLTAALEEASVADSINKLDFTLNDLGADMEDRSAIRRGRRTAAGAKLIRESRGTTARERKQLERSIRRQIVAQYDQATMDKKLGKRHWFRAKQELRWRFRRPNQIVIVDRDPDNSPWSEPRYFNT